MKIICGTTHCGEELGEIAPSPSGLRDYRPVWIIRPGWTWEPPIPGRGVLTFKDFSLRSERSLLHEAFGRQRLSVGMTLARECDLPIAVRCPKCHRVRHITPDLLLRRVS